MKRIQQIEIQNFKAFRELTTFPINGKNVLVYGNNGSGKSSVFWALYTFLQSSIKPQADVEKYFKYFLDSDKNTHQTLRNVFMEEVEDSFIKVTTIDTTNNLQEIFEISNSNINTTGNSTIQELNLASDFINYKVLHNFYSASHKNEVNLWGVFERDIFPFLAEGTKTWFEKIKDTTPDVPRRNGGARASGSRKRNFELKIAALNIEIDEFLAQITTQANDFIKKYFFNKKDVIRVNLSFDKKFTYNLVDRKIWKKSQSWREENLHIKLRVELYESDTVPNWTPIHRVQSFLNEAMLTRIAIGIRVGALRMRPQSPAFKILVIDDMLISLDLSNRMDVVRVILNKGADAELDRIFGGFQKIILTHDKGFFNLIRRHTNEEEWVYYNFTKDESNNCAPTIKEDLTPLQKAVKFFETEEFDNCGNELRKEAEAIMSHHLDPDMKKLNKDFETLSSKLEKAFKVLTNQRLQGFKNAFLLDFDIDKLRKINIDYSSDATLSTGEKRELDSIKKKMFDFLIEFNDKKNRKELLIKNTKEILDRVMNAASHHSENPLYRAELKDAIEGIKNLKAHLNT